MKEKKDLHLMRKIFHFIPAFIYVMLYVLFPDKRIFFENIIMKIFILTFMVDFLRLKNKPFNNFIVKIFAPFLRKEEVDSSSGIPSYVASLALISSFFPYPIIVLSLLYLSFCDPIASLFGILFKEHSYNIKFKNGKSLFGLIACYLSSCIITMIVGYIFGWSFPVIFTVAVLTGAVVALVECFPLDGINDNLLVPISSALFLIILLYLLGVI